MFTPALLAVLQTATAPAPEPDRAAPQPSSTGLELPTGARLLFTVDGVGRMDHLGKGIASLGDVNGDGTPDFLAGSVNGVPGLTQALGFADVFSGKDGKKLLHVDARGDSNGREGFGIRVGRIRDVDGDGVDEFFVGGEPDDGASYLRLCSGKTAKTLHTFTSGSAALAGLFDPHDLREIGDVDGDSNADFAVVGETQTCVVAGGRWERLFTIEGKYVGRADDLDGDGKRDYFCSFAGFEHAKGCVAAVLSSKAHGTEPRRELLVYAAMPIAGPLAAWSWAASGDANGDGYLDAVFAFYEPGRVANRWPALEDGFRMQLVSGKDASVLREWTEELDAPGDLLDVRFVGNFDFDGCDEIVVGRSGRRGSVSILSGKTGERLARIAGASWSFGVRSERLGDLDGDGRGELAIGEHEHEHCAGRVWVLSLPKF